MALCDRPLLRTSNRKVLVKDMHKGELFRDIAIALERVGHKMCVLHGYVSYPERIGSDIDAISENPAQIARILSEQKVALVVQASRWNATEYTYVLCRQYANGPVFIDLDVSADYRLHGRLFYSGKEFLEASRPFKFFRVPSADLEFGGYLIRRLMKRSLNEDQSQRLTELYEEDPAGCERQLERFFPKADAEFIARSARSGDWERVRERIEPLRRELLDKTERDQPLRRSWLSRLGAPWRRLKPILWPTGLMVAFLGVDGAGKSTVIARIARDLDPAFRDTKHYHKRSFPSIRQWTERYRARHRPDEHVPVHEDANVTVHSPHALPPRRLLASLAKLGFIWLDYTVLGYVIDIYPRLVRGTLVLFDRYYHDLLVDAKRYRYGGPLWLARAVGQLFPRTQLVILLDAPPEVLYSRRQEFPFEEIVRQREAYLEEVKSLPNGYVVDASKPLDEVVARVEQIILGYMDERTSRRSRHNLKSLSRSTGLGRARPKGPGAWG